MNNKAKYLIFISLIIFVCILLYTSIFYNQYPILLGDDGIRHINHSLEIIKTGFPNQILDPPFFHILISTISLITNLSPLSILTYGIPIIFIVVLLSVFMLVKKTLGINYAILACFLIALVSRLPLLTLEDGSLPSVFTSGFLFVFGLYFLYLALKHKYNIIYIFLSSIFFICLTLTHHLTFTYFAIFAAIMFCYLLIKAIIKKEFSPFFTLLIILAAVIIFGFLFILPYYGYSILNSVFSFILPNLNLGGTNTAQIVYKEKDVIPTFERINELIGSIFLIYSSILGLILFIADKIANKKQKDFSTAILISWPIAMLIGASLPITVEHLRYMRDTALPICIFSSIFIIFCLKIFQNKTYKICFSILIVVLLLIPFSARIKHYLEYNSMQRVQPVDTQAINWLKDNSPLDSTILITPGYGTRGWGDYISLLSNRPTAIIHDQYNEIELYSYKNPDSPSARKFFAENNIKYIYDGKEPIGWWPNLEKFPWHNYKLDTAENLQLKTEFKDKFGQIKIYEIKSN